jgi:hypothetical protein
LQLKHLGQMGQFGGTAIVKDDLEHGEGTLGLISHKRTQKTQRC